MVPLQLMSFCLFLIILNKCLFCSLVEKIFHVFTECGRLKEYFSVSTHVLTYSVLVYLFLVLFTALDTMLKKKRCQLVNFWRKVEKSN